MELVIFDKFDKSMIIQDPKFIPRLGDRIHWHYAPAPKVIQVVHDFDSNRILINLE